jgi:hypothetical protein
MAKASSKRVSALAGRIAAGKADPISPEERRIVAGLRASYEQKYGTTKQRPSRIKMVNRSKNSTSSPAADKGE